METIVIIALVAMSLITIGSLSVVGILVHSYIKSPKLKKPQPTSDTTPQHGEAAESNPNSSPTSDAAAKRRAEEEMKAFQKLMSYNADVAYGITTMKDSDE